MPVHFHSCARVLPHSSSFVFFFFSYNFIFLVCTFDGAFVIVVASVRACVRFVHFVNLLAYYTSSTQRQSLTLFGRQQVSLMIFAVFTAWLSFLLWPQQNNGRLDLWSGKVSVLAVCALVTCELWTHSHTNNKMLSFVVCVCGFAATQTNDCSSAGISEMVCPRRVEARQSADICLVDTADMVGTHGQHQSPKKHVGGTLFQSFRSHNLLVRITQSARLNALHCYLMIHPPAAVAAAGQSKQYAERQRCKWSMMMISISCISQFTQNQCAEYCSLRDLRDKPSI